MDGPETRATVGRQRVLGLGRDVGEGVRVWEDVSAGSVRVGWCCRIDWAGLTASYEGRAHTGLGG